jgi:hypothetical protein
MDSGSTPDYFLATIEAVANWAAELDLDHCGLHRNRLLRLRRRLASDAEPGAMAQGFQTLALSLRLLSQGAAEQQRVQVERTQEMAAILRRATREWKTRGERLALPMREAAGRLTKLAGTLEAGTARGAIETEAAEFRKRAEQTAAEIAATMAALEQEFQAVQHCLAPGASTVIDRATGLLARPEMERAFRERCESGRPFWLISARVQTAGENGYAAISNRALRHLAARFSEHVRPRIRWPAGGARNSSRSSTRPPKSSTGAPPNWRIFYPDGTRSRTGGPWKSARRWR